jgi:general secretion pathway protein I
MRRIEQDRTKTSGFTLVEVLVALAIAGLGLGLLVAATGSGLQSSVAAARATQAVSHAQSRLAQVGVTVPLKKGDYTGDGGEGFRWRVHVADPQTHGNADVVLYPVTVTEEWQDGGEQKRLSLYSERAGPP